MRPAGLSPQTVSEAASRVLPGGRRSVVSLRGSRVVLSYRLDEDECERRRAAGVGAITSPDVLNFCLGLPAGWAVPLEGLSPDERAMLDDVRSGVVAVAGGTVTRYAVPPLNVDLAMVPVCSWREGLEQAGRFAPFCARAMVLRTTPPDLDEVCVEAAFFGIGVVVAGDAEPRVLVAPEEFRRSRFTTAGWRFLEQVYEQVM